MGTSFHSGNETSHKGVTNTWFTPKKYVLPLGRFDLDPCTSIYRPFNTADKHLSEELVDGLSRHWWGRVWLNPPYGDDIGIWLDKLMFHGDGIALVFARMETAWAQKALALATAIFFIKGRITFIPSVEGLKSSNAANGSMYVIYGWDNVDAVINSGIKGTLMVRSQLEGIL